MKRKVSRKIIRTIPNKVFYEMWKAASEKPIYEYRLIAGSFYEAKWDIDYEHFLNMIDYIFNMANIPVKEIVEKSGMTKATISYVLGIPIRTLENWCSGIRPCPGYIKLMMLRYFGMFKLPHHIYMEAEVPICKKEEKRVEEQYIPKDVINDFHKWESEHIHNSKDETRELLDRLSYLDKYLK